MSSIGMNARPAKDKQRFGSAREGRPGGVGKVPQIIPSDGLRRYGLNPVYNPAAMARPLPCPLFSKKSVFNNKPEGEQGMLALHSTAALRIMAACNWMRLRWPR